jgi:hypothetical protein
MSFYYKAGPVFGAGECTVNRIDSICDKETRERSEGKIPPPARPRFHRCASLVCCNLEVVISCNLVLLRYVVTS